MSEPHPYPWKLLPFTDPVRVAAVVDLTALQAVQSAIYCSLHGCVHDPLRPPPRSTPSMCDPSFHRALYMEPNDMGHPTSDEDPGSFVPENPPRKSPNIDKAIRGSPTLPAR